MPPRRKSKKTADADADNASARSTPPPSASFAIGPLLQDVNLDALSNFFPDASLEMPSAVLVVQCYKLILNQAQQLDEKERTIENLEAETERLEIEVDQELQDKENLLSELDGGSKNVQKELAKVKKEKDEIAASRDALQAELEKTSSSQSCTSHEVTSVKRKIDEVEREKRDLLGVVSRLQEDAALRDEEITSLRENLKAARKETQENEAQLRDTRASERSTTFKVETLTHQLKLAKDENERTNDELAKKSEEFSTYRRDKHTELVQLQAELDSIKQTHNQTLTTLRALQSSHSSQSQQLAQALQRVQDLTAQLADQEVKYSSEAANLRRLVQMLEERETRAKELVAGIEKDWEGLGKKAAENERRLLSELEAEQSRTRELEAEVEQLRNVVDRVHSGEFPAPSASSADVSSDSLAGIGANISIISRMQKSGKTFTEVYSDYVKMQQQLALVTRERDHLDQTLARVLAELEENAPALFEQKMQIERLQAESNQLSTQLAQALADRDAVSTQLESANKTLEQAQKDYKLLHVQFEDSGRQIQHLLHEIGRLHDPSLPSDKDLEDIPPVSNIEDIITNNLVLFRSIPELQEQNRRLLACVRELGSRQETAEAECRARFEEEQNAAVAEAFEIIRHLESTLEETKAGYGTTIQALTKERDTLKTMLTRNRQGQTLPTGSPTRDTQASASSSSMNGIAREPTDLEKELEGERNKFDSFRQDMNIDTVRLREEAVKYQREASQLGAALAKANARIEYLNEKHRMTSEQLILHERESQDLQKRNQKLQDHYTRLEIASSHAAEEMAAAHAQIERLRNDCSNLRAEKKIWENVQSRLLEENKVLSLERSRMADLIANVQKMHNDIDRANENDRRRFESQIHALEAQTQDLRTQLSRERDTVRQVTLQKDIEVQDLRTKVDRSVENLSKARETLVEADTSRKHLQARVDGLVKQLQVNEEKLAVYERRTTSAAFGAGVPAAQPSANREVSDQDLKAEIVELRAALKANEVDLAAARSHVQQYHEISQASEAALQSLTSTHEEYKASAEARIAKYEGQQKSLEEQIGSLQEEINRLNAKNVELQQLLEKERVAFAQDKKMLEDTIVDITTSEANQRSDQAAHEQEVREQMERARAAEEKYSREIVAHAESIKIVDDLKDRLSEARTALREKTTQAETAQANVIASETSWNQQREALNKEISDLTARCKDLAAQNALLHQHLESVSSQASRIRQAADSDVNVADGGDGDEADGRIAELRSVIAYLRKEKEIVDLQLELAKQENARQKTQIDHLSRALEETRTALSNEREEAAKAFSNSAEHTELLERINQLNILRESNATLRAESDAHLRKARQLEMTLHSLRSEFGPLKEEATTLRAELDVKDAQIQRLEDENRQWKERNSQLLTKYDRIDPNDVQALKDEIEDLQIDLRKAEEEKAAFVAEKEAQTKLLEGTQATLAEFRTKYSSLAQESRNRLGQLNQQNSKLQETIAELRKQVKDLTAEKEEHVAQVAATPSPSADSAVELESLRTQLAAALQEKETTAKLLADETNKAVKTVADHEAALSALREERDRLLADKASGQTSESQSSESGDTQQVRQQFETEKAGLAKACDEALARAKAAEDRTVTALNEARNLRMQNEKFQARIVENEKRRIADGEKIAALSEKHKQEQERAITEATEKLRAELQNPGADTSEVAARHAEELRALEVRLVAEHEAELRAAIEKAREEVAKTVGQVPQDVVSKEEYEQALKAATERGRMESVTKLKLKDSMLQKAQANVKHLEAQIKAWREAGIVPANAPTIPPGSATTPAKTTTTGPVPAKPGAIAPTPSTAATAMNSATTSKAGAPVSQASGPSTSTPTPAALPKKPMTANAGTATTSAVGTAEASARGARGGAVRGMRGARGARGAARGGAVRGGAPAAVAQAAQAAAAANAAEGGVSIIGAAAKRAREDAPENTIESLAKRIKPADGAATKPIALRRDRIATTPNPAPSS